jgi:hypothetical protein
MAVQMDGYLHRRLERLDDVIGIVGRDQPAMSLTQMLSAPMASSSLALFT